MSRNGRVVVAFAFGAALVLAGLGAKLYEDEIAVRWYEARGYPSYSFNAGRDNPSIAEAATALLAGGLMIEGLALLGWIIAPRDDR